MKITSFIISLLMVAALATIASGQEKGIAIRGVVSEFQWEFDDQACSAMVGTKYLIEVSATEGKPLILCRELHQRARDKGMLDVQKIVIPAQITISSALDPEDIISVWKIKENEEPTTLEFPDQPEAPYLDADFSDEKVTPSGQPDSTIEETDLMEPQAPKLEKPPLP